MAHALTDDGYNTDDPADDNNVYWRHFISNYFGGNAILDLPEWKPLPPPELVQMIIRGLEETNKQMENTDEVVELNTDKLVQKITVIVKRYQLNEATAKEEKTTLKLRLTDDTPQKLLNLNRNHYARVRNASNKIVESYINMLPNATVDVSKLRDVLRMGTRIRLENAPDMDTINAIDSNEDCLLYRAAFESLPIIDKFYDARPDLDVLPGESKITSGMLVFKHETMDRVRRMVYFRLMMEEVWGVNYYPKMPVFPNSVAAAAKSIQEYLDSQALMPIVDNDLDLDLD